MKEPYGFWGLLWRLTLAGAIVLGASAAGGFAVAKNMIEAPETQAPDLLTLRLDDAVELASQQGFSVILEKKEPSTLLEAGRIISQRPAPQAWIKEGSTLRLTVAEKAR